MKKNLLIEHEFVDFIPGELKERTLYISIEFATATHKCFCGCGSEVVTPISPVGWRLTFDGDTVSLAPSIGSWSLRCKSHYWIRRNMVQWAGEMSPEEIAAVRRRDDRDRLRYYEPRDAAAAEPAPPSAAETIAPAQPKGLWGWLKRLLE
jgi:Family of unknown function (DUF6527)